MLFFIFLFSFIYSKTYQYLNASFADAFIKQKDCYEASVSYYEDFKKTKNILLASNYAASLFCLKKIDKAKYYINYAYINRALLDDENNKQAIMYNFAHIYSFDKLFSVSQNVLESINIGLLEQNNKANYFALKCRNHMFLNNHIKAEEYCIKAYSINKNSCFITSVFLELSYKNQEYLKAISLIDNMFAKCKNEDISYYYSLSLYKTGERKKAKEILSSFTNAKRNKEMFDLISKNLYLE
jgi:hypothetical protein